jgi:hypothetical protein
VNRLERRHFDLEIDAASEGRLEVAGEPACRAALLQHQLRVPEFEISKVILFARKPNAKADDIAVEPQTSHQVRDQQFRDQRRPFHRTLLRMKGVILPEIGSAAARTRGHGRWKAACGEGGRRSAFFCAQKAKPPPNGRGF